MIVIALGANLETKRYGTPQNGLSAALHHLVATGVTLKTCSNWYQSAPFPTADQPWYVNGVAEIACEVSPVALMARMLSVETEFGRQRDGRNAARVLDLDLIDYNGKILNKPADDNGPAVQLPHPRLHERAFVLLPLAEIAADWRHPKNGRHIDDLITELPPGQKIERMHE